MDNTTPPYPADHEKRLRAAEAVARWELGDRGWAGRILSAYWSPDEAMENLRREMEPEGVQD